MTTILTQWVARLLLAPIFVVAVAVLVKGYSDVGDGFSAGVIAALGVLLQYSALGRERAERELPVRYLPAASLVGLLGALAIALVPVAAGDPPLSHVPGPNESVVQLGTLELITAVAFDVAIFLLVLGAVVGMVRAVAQDSDEEPPR